MHQITKENVSLNTSLFVDSIALSTSAMEEDLSVVASIELRAEEETVNHIRGAVMRSGKTSVSYHAVDGTVQGKQLVEVVLERLSDLSEISFPVGWDLDVEIQEVPPREEERIRLKLNGGQDADGVATLLGSVGIVHDYDSC